MATWTPIDTTTASTASRFNPFANFAYAEGCFADGTVYDPWNLIGTAQTPNWGVITASSNYNFNPFANFAYAEGAFADGTVYDPWTLISTN